MTAQPATLLEGSRHDAGYKMLLRLTLLLVILRGVMPSWGEATTTILVGAMLVLPGLLVRRALWFTLFATLAVGTARLWYSNDNHQYLIAYWVLACGCSLGHAAPMSYLRRTAGTMVGLVFLLAVIWKLALGEYWDGRFLYWTFLTDPRITRLAAWLSGISIQDIGAGTLALRVAGSNLLYDITIPLVDAPLLTHVTLCLSWAALLLEGVVGIVHLLPGERIYLVKHASLMTFIVGTYFLLPVVGFAYVLSLLGFAGTEARDLRLRWAYLAILAAVHLTVIPWQNVLSV